MGIPYFTNEQGAKLAERVIKLEQGGGGGSKEEVIDFGTVECEVNMEEGTIHAEFEFSKDILLKIKDKDEFSFKLVLDFSSLYPGMFISETGRTLGKATDPNGMTAFYSSVVALEAMGMLIINVNPIGHEGGFGQLSAKAR